MFQEIFLALYPLCRARKALGTKNNIFDNINQNNFQFVLACQTSWVIKLPIPSLLNLSDLLNLPDLPDIFYLTNLPYHPKPLWTPKSFRCSKCTLQIFTPWKLRDWELQGPCRENLHFLWKRAVRIARKPRDNYRTCNLQSP